MSCLTWNIIIIYNMIITIIFRVDEVWLPSQFLMDVFSSCGVDQDKLRIIPIPLDTYFYDPKAITSLYPLKNKGEFNFLSVFKWEKRKGWDILLEAYLTEFTKQDKTTLYLQTYLYGVAGYMARDEEQIMNRVVDYAIRELKVVKNREEFDRLMPRVEILAKVTSPNASIEQMMNQE